EKRQTKKSRQSQSGSRQPFIDRLLLGMQHSCVAKPLLARHKSTHVTNREETMTVLHPPAPQTNRPESLPQTPEGSPRREKLRDASRGLKLGIRSHSSFFVHFFFAMLVLATGLALHCSAVEWCLLGGCFAMVFITELCSSAV